MLPPSHATPPAPGSNPSRCNGPRTAAIRDGLLEKLCRASSRPCVSMCARESTFRDPLDQKLSISTRARSLSSQRAKPTERLPWRSGRSRRSRRSGANQKALGGGVRKMALVRTGCPRAMGCLPHPRRLRTRVLALGRVGQRMERRAKRFRGDLIRPPARATSRTSHAPLLLRPRDPCAQSRTGWTTRRAKTLPGARAHTGGRR